MCSTFSEPGWNISARGLKLITNNDTIKDKRVLFQNALNADLKDIGASILCKELNKSRITELVLQIQKIRNVSAPKANEGSMVAPRMLKLILTDGESYAQAVETSNISTISREKTPPGSKLLLRNVEVVNGFLILTPENTKLLGGKVPHMFEKWELAKSVQHCSRPTAALDGPPAWVNFGNKITAGDEIRQVDIKLKEQSKENTEFENLRQGAIAEASTGAVKKVFGGGVKQPVLNIQRNDNRGRLDAGRGFNKVKKENKNNRDKEVNDVPLKPSDKVSLFSFLEDKLNITETTTNTSKPREHEETNYNEFGKSADPKKTNNYDDYPNTKFNNQRKDHNYYNERRYNTSREPQGNYVSARMNRESTKSQEHFKSARYDVPNEAAHRDAVINKTVMPPNRNQVYFNSTRNKRDIHEKQQHFNSNGNVNINESKNTTELTKELNRSHENHNFNARNNVQEDNNLKMGRSSTISNRNKEKNDNWHYRAPDKTNSGESNGSSIDHLSDSMNKVSMNSEFASRSLRQHLNLNMKKTSTVPIENTKPSSNNLDSISWKVGDECLAKYWEDEKFYPAKITACTENTFVVQFKGYGNIEEVLKSDCTSLKSQSRGEDKRQFISGTLEFRRNPRKFTYS